MTQDPSAAGTTPEAAPDTTPAPVVDVPAVERALTDARAETLHRLGRLTGHFDELVAASANSNADDEHDPEGATIAFERSQLDSLVRRAREHLAEIEAARVRLEQGRYGVCEACGRPVDPRRLEARPVARTCLACAVGPVG